MVLSSDPAWIEGVAILLAVVISSLVTATNDYQKANKFRELYEHEQEKKEVEVVRAGKRTAIVFSSAPKTNLRLNV